VGGEEHEPFELALPQQLSRSPAIENVSAPAKEASVKAKTRRKSR
jgi:hypothetical protein